MPEIVEIQHEALRPLSKIQRAALILMKNQGEIRIVEENRNKKGATV